MKIAPPPEPADVVYWKCPRGDGEVFVLGDAFGSIAALGITVETGDLAAMLPTTLLDDAEELVERHELTHHGIGADGLILRPVSA